MATHRQLVPCRCEADLDALIVADILVVCELLRWGYTPKALYRVWRAVPPTRSDQAVEQVRHALKIIRKTTSTAAPSWLIDHFGLTCGATDAGGESA